jgi:hypothetical protein
LTRIRLFAALLAVTTLLAAPAIASASSSAISAQPTYEQIYSAAQFVAGQDETVSIAPQAMRKEAAQMGASSDQLAAIAASSGCWSKTFWVELHNGFGWTLFRYNESHDWCGDGTWVTYTWVHTSPSNLFAGVSYVSDSKYSVYGIGWNVWKENLTGHFQALPTPFGHIYNYYPWMEFYVGGGGQTYYEHWGGDATCSIYTC